MKVMVRVGGKGWRGYVFFSSRRRHTRFDCDWSSDVCSSDLRHLADKLVEKLVSALFRGVHGGIEDAPAPLDFVRTRAACQFRMSDKPRSAVDRKSVV